jgi:hypothetical protein
MYVLKPDMKAMFLSKFSMQKFHKKEMLKMSNNALVMAVQPSLADTTRIKRNPNNSG